MLSDRAIRACRARFHLATSVAPGAAPPALEIVLDASLSMTAGDGAKDQRARELAILLLKLGEQAGCRARVIALRGRGRNVRLEASDASRIAQIPFDGCAPVFEELEQDRATLEPGGMRVVLSDFLSPDDPAPPLRRLAKGARVWLLQILDAWELEPELGGPMRLRDAESDEELELLLDASAIESYQARLHALLDRLEQASRSADARLVTACAAIDLEALCAEQLVPAGLLVEPPSAAPDALSLNPRTP